MTIRVAIAGSTGTLGRVVTAVVERDAGFELVAAMDSTSPLDQMLGADVLVDATHPAVSASIVEFAVRNGVRVLVGTSGWSAARILELERLTRDVPDSGVVVIPNFSLGSALGTALAAVAARFFESIEIVEAHGENKVDSPSGTAVRTAELIGAARAGLGPVDAPHNDQRARGQQVASVPIHSLRVRGTVASQQVVFGGTGETLTIRHDTVDASSYEAGIALGIRAAAERTGVTVGLDKLVDLGFGFGFGESAGDGAGAGAPANEIPTTSVREV